MIKLVEIVGNVLGPVGALLCVAAGVMRLAGSWYLVGFETMVLFNVGIGLMVVGCLAKLHVLSSR